VVPNTTSLRLAFQDFDLEESTLSFESVGKRQTRRPSADNGYRMDKIRNSHNKLLTGYVAARVKNIEEKKK
jgi:hypothetical protein